MKYEGEDLKKCCLLSAAILSTLSRSGMLKIATTYKLTTSHHQVVTFCNLAGTFQIHLLHHLEELSEPKGRNHLRRGLEEKAVFQSLFKTGSA